MMDAMDRFWHTLSRERVWDSEPVLTEHHDRHGVFGDSTLYVLDVDDGVGPARRVRHRVSRLQAELAIYDIPTAVARRLNEALDERGAPPLPSPPDCEDR